MVDCDGKEIHEGDSVLVRFIVDKVIPNPGMPAWDLLSLKKHMAGPGNSPAFCTIVPSAVLVVTAQGGQ